MRIAILTERMKIGFGVDLVVHEQASRLVNQHEVVVFPIEADDIFISNVPYSVYKLQIPLAFNPIKQDWNALKKYFVYSHILQSFDVFIIHTPTFNTWVPFLRKYGKVIMYCYGNSPSNNYPFPKNLRKNVLDFLEHVVYYPFATKIVSISNFLRNSLPPFAKKKTSVLYLGNEHITTLASRLTKRDITSFKEKYFLGNNEKIVTYIGRLDYKNNPYKNTRMLLRLNNFLKEKYGSSFRLIAIGFPENNIEKVFFKHGVTVLPKASATDLVCALKLSSVYVSPSLWEGFNLPLVEAQRLGIPVVAYNLAAHPEVVISGETGYLVRTPKDFFDKVDVLLRDDKLRKRMSKRALAFSSKFSWDSHVKDLEALL